MVSRRKGDPAVRTVRRELRSALSSSGRSSTIKHCAGTMKVWVICSRSTVFRNATASKVGITCSVPPANRIGNIISHVPLE